MGDNLSEQAIVLNDSGEINRSQGVTRLRLFNEDGTPYTPSSGGEDSSSGYTPPSGYMNNQILIWDNSAESWVVSENSLSNIIQIAVASYLRGLNGYVPGETEGVLHIDSLSNIEWRDPVTLGI